MSIDLGEKKAVIGRSLHDLEKYREKGTAYIGKVVMSSGENPVLGRKILMDIAKPHVVLICGKRGGGKCLDGDTLITLEDGSLTPIKALEKDKRKILNLNHKYKIEKANKTEFYKRKVNRMLKISLRSGKEIKLTPEHPLLTINGWIPVQELNKGSRIATPRKTEVFGREFLKESEVKLLAYLIAEGHTKLQTVWFSNEDKVLIEDFKNAVNDFDLNLTVNLSQKNNYRVVCKSLKKKILGDKKVNPHTLKNWLKELGIYNLTSANKVIPEIIFKIPKQKVALFLNRYFSCDGTIYFDSNTKSWRVSCASNSEQIIRSIQHLLTRFEIFSILRKKINVLNEKTFGSFELELKGENIEKFLKEISFFGEKELRQKNALQEIRFLKRNPNIDTVPKEIWDHYRPKNWAEIGRKIGYKFPKSLRESMHYSPSRQKLLQIARADENELIQLIAQSDIFWDEIKSIEELNGDFWVYDLTVPENHNFVANDIIVHNSYSLAVLLEEFARQPISIKKRISVIAIDTVGIFWTLKVPNKEEKAELFNWDLTPDKTDARVLVPKGKLSFYKEKKIPVDGAFTLKVSELGSEEWLALFNLSWKEAEGVLLSRIVDEIKEKFGTLYDIPKLISAVQLDKDADKKTKDAVIGRLKVAKSWGLFEKEGTKIKDLAEPGKITIIDVSAYRQAIGMEGTREIIVALIGKKLFEERMLYRKEEEIKLIEGEKKESDMPIVWMLIDEAHMFMPKDRESIALKVLLEWVRVGRQPGLSLVLATQRPNKLHPDSISQCDLFISHRMTSQPDIEAVSALRPSYMHQNFDKYYQEMPRSKGFALILDDNTENLWMVKIRPRFSWDGGVTASAFTE